MVGSRSKREFLEAAGALNPSPERVRDEKFQREEGEFFDPQDKIQLKYEMLRAQAVDGETVTEAAERFGYTRESFYQNQKRLRQEGIVGLADRKKGRQGPEKLQPKILQFLRERKRQDPSLSGARLAALVQEQFGVSLHRRTVERALPLAGPRQKKRRRPSTPTNPNGLAPSVPESGRAKPKALRAAAPSSGVDAGGSQAVREPRAEDSRG